MKDFVIMTDSCCDLPREYVDEKKIPFVSLTCRYDNKEYIDDFGQSLTHKEFYKALREGALPNTSQANSQNFYNKFKELVEGGKDIIYVGVSSGLSGTHNSANVGRNMIKEEHPEAKIYILDVLTASIGQGIMVKKAIDMQENGYSKEEIVKTLQNEIPIMNTYMTVQDLNYLKRGGRISGAAATLGIVLHIKPILTLNHEGKVMTVVKVRGRKKAINVLADVVAEKIENAEEQVIAISHGDCYDEALKLKEEILKKVKVKDVIVSYIGPVVGVFGGPEALAVNFIGKERQHHVIDI